jgi:hypothetical protein
VLQLYREKYADLNVRHFHEKLREAHGIELSYTWVKLALQGAGLVKKGRRRGVHLRRAFGFGNTSDFDPFLLLDDFCNDVPEDYPAGFPWHPHRGIETITYVLAATVEYGDSMGNHGAIATGDVTQRHRTEGYCVLNFGIYDLCGLFKDLL